MPTGMIERNMENIMSIYSFRSKKRDILIRFIKIIFSKLERFSSDIWGVTKDDVRDEITIGETFDKNNKVGRLTRLVHLKFKELTIMTFII